MQTKCRQTHCSGPQPLLALGSRYIHDRCFGKRDKNKGSVQAQAQIGNGWGIWHWQHVVSNKVNNLLSNSPVLFCRQCFPVNPIVFELLLCEIPRDWSLWKSSWIHRNFILSVIVEDWARKAFEFEVETHCHRKMCAECKVSCKVEEDVLQHKSISQLLVHCVDSWFDN